MQYTNSDRDSHQPSIGSAARVDDDLVFQDLLVRLSTGTTDTRVEAAHSLSRYGEPALAPLCEAVRGDQSRVREAAAEVLGEIGDERSIRPLTDALMAEHGGTSPRLHYWIGLAILAAIVLAVGSVLLGIAMFKISVGGFASAWIAGAKNARDRRRKRLEEHASVRTAIVRALARIAERHPSPELLRLVPDLKAIAADSLRQQEQTRDASREAAARIESVTEQLRRMPVAAEAPAEQQEALPRPAEAPSPDISTLPRTFLEKDRA